MAILIPKYKDILIEDAGLGVHSSFSGEYRVSLRGSDGRIRYKTDWRPNTLLNNGLNYLRTTVNTFESMALGTSDLAVDITQTGLQGTELGIHGFGTAVSITTPTGPNYERVSVKKWVFVEGVATGLIKEFILYPQGYSTANSGTVRVVLDVAIDKLANDELTIEHRMTWHINTVDVTGVINISGEAYDYTIRHCNVLYPDSAHQDDIVFNDNSNQLKAYHTDLVALTDPFPLSGSVGSWGPGGITTGGTFPDYWGQNELVAGVDYMNGNISMLLLSNVGFLSTGLNTQF